MDRYTKDIDWIVKRKWRLYNCLEVGIWEEQLPLEDGLLRRLSVIKEDVIVKAVFIEISSAVPHKNVR